MSEAALSPGVAFPPANYLIAASRLRPGLDGGYTVATLRRAMHLADHGGVQPTLLTFDLWPDVDAFASEFVSLGIAREDTRFRNLLVELRARPEVLRDAARAPDVDRSTTSTWLSTPRSAPDPERAERVEGRSATELDARGIPWRRIVRADDGRITHTDFFDATGAPLFRLPYVGGRADWWRADIDVEVTAADGRPVGRLDGFGGLYRAWFRHLVSEAPHERTVVIVEARQVGELLLDHGLPGVSLVHTVHNAHTLEPHAWDSPVDETWAGWFGVAERFDAIVWLTERQRADAERRFGAHPRSAVIPHPAQALADLPPVDERDPNRAVLIARLAPQKRIDHAIRAWALVLERNQDARLDVYGDGPLRGELQTLIAELGLAHAVTLHGHRPDAAEELRTAALLLVSSRHEGQVLVVLEALARGCPVVGYDVNYGMDEMVEHGVSGLLVEPGDIAALAEAITTILGDPTAIDRHSRAAHRWALAHGPARSMALTAALARALIPQSTVSDKE